MNIEQEIKNIQERNMRVAGDKAWEISRTRKFSICFVTYIIAGLVMTSLGLAQPWINAFIPTLGYFLSTLSLPFIKGYWLKNFYKDEL